MAAIPQKVHRVKFVGHRFDFVGSGRRGGRYSLAFWMPECPKASFRVRVSFHGVRARVLEKPV